MLSKSAGPKVIIISGFHCISYIRRNSLANRNFQSPYCRITVIRHSELPWHTIGSHGSLFKRKFNELWKIATNGMIRQASRSDDTEQNQPVAFSFDNAHRITDRILHPALTSRNCTQYEMDIESSKTAKDRRKSTTRNDTHESRLS